MNRKRFDRDPVEALRRADPLDRLEVFGDPAVAERLTQQQPEKTPKATKK